MKLSDIYAIANELAPKKLSDEMCRNYGAYDNSGILVNTGEEIDGIAFSLDLSYAVIDRAIESGANLIVTHHPAIYGKISDVRVDGSPLGEKLVKCIRNGISVIAMHLNLDLADDGIDESLMQGILLSAGQTDGAGTEVFAKQIEVSEGAYGRVYAIPRVTLQRLSENMKKTFSTERVEVYGNKNKTVTRAASFCGAGADEGTVAFAAANGAEVMISSDFKHHVLALALEKGLSVITLTHYASEQYGFKKYYEKIRQQVKIPCFYHTDDMLF